MEIRVKIEKRHFFAIMSALFVIAGIFVVYAYNSSGVGGVPSVMGHSVDEIDWSKTINSPIVIKPAAVGPTLRITPPVQFAGAVTISSTNDTNTANAPLEIRASQTVFTMGDVCTTAGGIVKCLSTSGTASLGSCKTICFNSYSPAPCDAYMSDIATWRYGFDCSTSFPGYPIVSGLEEDFNGQSYFVAKVKCCALA